MTVSGVAFALSLFRFIFASLANNASTLRCSLGRGLRISFIFLFLRIECEKAVYTPPHKLQAANFHRPLFGFKFGGKIDLCAIPTVASKVRVVKPQKMATALASEKIADRGLGHYPKGVSFDTVRAAWIVCGHCFG